MTDAVTEQPAVAFGRRAAALLAASCPHLPRVLDVTVLGERRELVLEEPHGPTLAALLARRRRLPPGEAATVVIAVVRAVAALHDAGYCGVSLAAERLRFDVLGTPVLLGLDGVRETLLAGAQGLADDWRAVAALADGLGLVAHGRAAGALGPAHVGLGLALAALTAGESEQGVDRLETAIFELAEPEAVRLDGAEAASAEPAAAVVSPLAARRRVAAHRRPSGSVLIEAFEAGPAALLAGPLGRIRSRVAGLGGRLRGRTRLLLIGVGIVVLLVVVAVALLPQRSSPSAATGSAGGSAVGSASASPAVRARGGASKAGVVPSAAPSASGGATPAGGAALLGDDPVAAASVLLAERDRCLPLGPAAQQSCLAAVADGPASVLEQPDRRLAALAPSLLERTGDSALVALTPQDAQTPPASALLMRTEAGWRLRQLYEN